MSVGLVEVGTADPLVRPFRSWPMPLTRRSPPPGTDRADIDFAQVCPPGWPAPPDAVGTGRPFHPKPSDWHRHDRVCVAKAMIAAAAARRLNRIPHGHDHPNLDTSTSVLPEPVEAIAGTSNLARDGHVVDMRGMDTQAFMRAGTILWAHDQQQPVGNPVSCYVDGGGNLRIVVDFAPEGVSSTADEIRL
jgi:hypothetical protein